MDEAARAAFVKTVAQARRSDRLQPLAAGRARRRGAQRPTHGVRSRSSPREGFTFRQFPKELAEVGSPRDVMFSNIGFRGNVLES